MFSTPSVNLSQFNVEPGMTVADLGCGSGAYTLELSNRVGANGKVFALDVQKNLVDKLANECKQKELHNVSVMWDDLDDANGIGLKDSSIDRVVVANALFQIDDIQSFAMEVKRILKPKGLALIIDWSESFGGLGPTPQAVIKKERALEAFTKVGMNFMKDVNAGDHHYGFVVQCNT